MDRAQGKPHGGRRNECSAFELSPSKLGLWSLDMRHPRGAIRAEADGGGSGADRLGSVERLVRSCYEGFL